MTATYQAPLLVHYGSVTALTASFLKCSPGNDGAFSTMHIHSVDPVTGEVDNTGENPQGHEQSTGENCFLFGTIPIPP